MAARIQRLRKKGWRLPPGAVIVDRTSRRGNPFVVGADADDAEEATAMYAAWLEQNSRRDLDPYGSSERWRRLEERREWILAHMAELEGKDLACPCDLPEPGQPDHCHAAYLISICNPLLEAFRRA